jgi:hypothetical protein
MIGLDIFGPLLILLGLALMTVTPLHMVLTKLSPHSGRSASFLSDIYPVSAPNPALDAMVRNADEALALDPLIRATEAIAETYDQV